MSTITDTSWLRRARPALQRTGPGVTATALSVAVIGGMGLLLVQTSMVASAGYENERLQDERAALQHGNQELEAEIASLRSMDRIEREARDQLGMVPAGPFIYVSVDPSLKDPPNSPTAAEPSPERPPSPGWSISFGKLFGGGADQ